MSLTSYAQNFEDVILWRALKHVEKGFYIDVGAGWPDRDSVTLAFYERGWSGINVEPNTDLLNQLSEHRPRDTNLGFAISDSPGRAGMSFIEDTGLSTLDISIANQHMHSGYAVHCRDVEVVTLQHVCETYLTANQPIHFLKVDVEGLEEQVLRSNDWKSHRPWVVVIEATAPMSQVESYEGSETILEEADYRFCYSDGLNRFYVAAEHPELLPAFKYPPNVFDGFKTYTQALNEEASIKAAERLEETLRELTTVQAKTDRLIGELEEKGYVLAETQALLDQEVAYSQWLKNEIEALQQSRSWRITQPLRTFSRLAQSLTRHPKHAANWTLEKIIKFTVKHPTFRHKASAWVNYSSRLRSRLKQFAENRNLIPQIEYKNSNDVSSLSENSGRRKARKKGPHHSTGGENLSLLTPREKQIYRDLKAFVTEKRDEKN